VGFDIAYESSASLGNIDKAAFSVDFRTGDANQCGNMTTPTRFPLNF
jgi:hypothetical protein